MPSFRALLSILELRPGHRPEDVMESATAAVGSAHLIEAHHLDVVAGIPRITVRFMVETSTDADENDAACQAATNMRHAVQQVADVGRLGVLRRNRGRWEPV
ncbi:hypothetical protein [Arthrobacter monumenti]